MICDFKNTNVAILAEENPVSQHEKLCETTSVCCPQHQQAAQLFELQGIRDRMALFGPEETKGSGESKESRVFGGLGGLGKGGESGRIRIGRRGRRLVEIRKAKQQ